MIGGQALGVDTTDETAALRLLRHEQQALAAVAAERAIGRSPNLVARLGDLARGETTRTAVALLAHLQVALETERPALFDAHVRWAASVEASPALTADELRTLVEILGEVVVDRVGAAGAVPVSERITAAFAALDTLEPPPATTLDPATPCGRLATGLLEALIDGDRAEGVALLASAIRIDMTPQRLAREVITPCLREVGHRWQRGRLSVAQEHLVSSSIQLIMAQLPRSPRLVPHNGRRAVVSAVGGERHEIGARLVADAFEARGWTCDLLGADTPTTALVAYVEAVRPDVVALSATIASHLATLRRAIPALRAVHTGPILVGGRAFHDVDDLWVQVGADGTASDGEGAVALADELVAA